MNTTIHTRQNAALWASAFVLGALVILQAGRVFSPSSPSTVVRPDAIASLFESRAMASGGAADLVSTVGPYSIMTFDGGSEDIIVVLDNRAEEMYSYKVQNQKSLEFLGRESIKEIFASARLAGSGSGRK